MILRFKRGLRWKIKDKVAFLFFKLNDIFMSAEHAKTLLVKGKNKLQNFLVKI